ncbi:MAG: hypothetical protein ACREP7_18170, partial [Lysobacter sp.]
MQKSMQLLISLGLLLGAANAAHAQTKGLPEQWTFCDTCVTSTDFSNAARSWVPSTGTYEVLIGNTQSGDVYHVSITASNSPITPNVVAPGTSAAKQAVPAGRQTVQSSPPYKFVNWALRLDDGLRNQFKAAVVATQSQVMATANDAGAPDVPALDHFTGGDMEIISPFLWNAMSVAHPGWNTGGYTNPVMQMLWQSLKSLFGRGPSACLVYKNGDVACYQLNMIDRNAALYLEGTAIDRDGHAIGGGGGGGGGGDGVGVHEPIGGNVYY